MPIEAVAAMDVISADTWATGAAASAAFLTAFAGSGHCALMCGPLACVGLQRDRGGWVGVATAWHAGRLMMYGLAGVALGALGHAGLGLMRAPVARAAPWIMAAGLVLSAFEVGRRLPALPGLARLPRLLGALAAPLPSTARAALRGAATPFLPCGLLYGGFVMAAGAGSSTGGALVMLAFAAGALPGLALVQVGAPRLAPGTPARALLRRAVPLLAAAVVVWRAVLAHDGVPHCH